MGKRETYLENWIRSVLVGTIKQSKDKPCSHLVLMHMIGESESEVMRSTPGTGVDLRPEDYAKMFMEAAKEDAHDLPGSQHYSIKAYYGTESHEGRHVFSVAGEGQAEDGYMSESPNAVGQTMQRMRQGEALYQLYIRGHATLQEASQQFITMQNRLLIDTLRENRELIMGVKDMIMKESREEHAMRMKEQEYVRNAGMLKSMMDLFGPLANTLTGKEIVPQSYADTKVFEAIAEKVNSREELAGLQMILGPEVGTIVMNRLWELAVKKKAEREELENASRARSRETPNGALPPELSEGEPHVQ